MEVKTPPWSLDGSQIDFPSFREKPGIHPGQCIAVTLAWIVLGVVFLAPFATVAKVSYGIIRARIFYIHYVVRIFLESPLFQVPRSKPDETAEDFRIKTADGLSLAAIWIPPRSPLKGVILFGIEFGSNRWSCLHYCQNLLDAGFAVFAFEPRNQGESDFIDGYKPLHWVTGHEVIDARAALDYVSKRPEVIKLGGFGIFGISRGGSALMFAAGENPLVKCVVTDGIYATYSLMVPYIRQWINIYIKDNAWIHDYLPDWVCGWFAHAALREVEATHKLTIPFLESHLHTYKSKPLLMIHGADDRYIKPLVAEKMFQIAGGGKKGKNPDHHEIWIIEKAKHNEGIQKEPIEYPDRVRRFFDRYLVSDSITPVQSSQTSEESSSSKQIRDHGHAVSAS